MLCKKLEMIPLEVITRNIAAGSLIKKFPFKNKQKLNPPIIQMDYKNDEYHDPMLNDSITVCFLGSCKSRTTRQNKRYYTKYK